MCGFFGNRYVLMVAIWVGGVKIISFLKKIIAPLIYGALVFCFFKISPLNLPVDFLRGAVGFLFDQSKYLSFDDVRLLVNQMLLLFVLALIAEGCEGVLLFLRHRDALESIFGGNFFAYKKDFSHVAWRGLLGIVLSAVLVVSIVRKSRDLPRPFDLDFIYVGLVMYIAAAAFVETLKYFSLFILSTRR